MPVRIPSTGLKTANQNGISHSGSVMPLDLVLVIVSSRSRFAFVEFSLTKASRHAQRFACNPRGIG